MGLGGRWMRQQIISIAPALIAALALIVGADTARGTQGDSTDGAAPSGALLPWALAGAAVLCGTTGRGGRYDRGTVFCLTPDGQERLLHSFAGGPMDGAEPLGTLVRGRDGGLFGVTASGGRCEHGEASQQVAGCGTLFHIAADGAERLVHAFSGFIEPVGGLIQATDGSFLGIGPDQVYRLTPDGTESVLHQFAGGKTDGSDPAGLLEANNGVFYGTTRSGGAFNHGTVFALTAAGAERLIYSFRGGADGDFPSAPLIQGSDGALYGTTTYGGVNANMSTLCDRGCGTVFRITSDGRETVLHAFRGGMLDGVHPTSSLTQSSDGMFYGTTSGGGSDTDVGPGTVFRLSADGAHWMAYAFRDETEGVYPSALAQGVDGSFYGTAGGGRLGQGVVFRISSRGRIVVLHGFGGSSKR